MVKELSMDNSIFALGTVQDTNTKVSDETMSVESFENVFETAKNSNYTDKGDFNTNSEKVVKAAEKSVQSEKSDKAATDITKVNNKKVSTKITTKSPKNTAETTCATVEQKNVDSVSDAYSFSVKEALSSDNSTTSEDLPEVIETEEFIAETPELETDIQNDSVSNEIQQKTDTNLLSKAQTLVTEVINALAQKVNTVTATSSSKSTEEEEDQNASAVQLLDTLLATEEETEILNLGAELTETIDMVDDTTTLSEVFVDTETEETTQNAGVTGAAADIEIPESESGTIELGEGWEIVNEETELPLSDEELTNITEDSVQPETELKTSDKDMNKLDIKDVKPHTPDEINKKPTTQDVETGSNEIATDNSPVDIETMPETTSETQPVITETNDEIVNTKTESVISENEVTPVIVEEKIEKEITVETPVQAEEEEEETEAAIDNKPTISDDIEISDDSPSNFDASTNSDNAEKELQTKDKPVISDSKTQINQNSETKVTNNSKEINNEIKVDAETVKPEVTDSKAQENLVETEEPKIIEVDEKEIILPEETEKNNTEFATSTQNEKQEVSESYKNEDLDLYIENCIKLAFVDTSNKTTEEPVNIIEQLENRFIEDTEIEITTDLDNSTELLDSYDFSQEELPSDTELKNVSSLSEIVDTEEVEDLNLQLKESFNTNSKKETASSTMGSTTEQLIRFSIEGEAGYEPTTEFTTLKTQTPVQNQQAVPSSAKDVLEQLSEKLSTFNLKTGSKLTMQLNPENLGKIEIKLTNTAQGITAEMTVSSDETCDMMKKNLDDLKETLQKYGVRFDNVSVKTSVAQQTSNQQDYTEQNNSNKQQPQQERQNEKQEQKAKAFEDIVNSFANEEIEE